MKKILLLFSIFMALNAFAQKDRAAVDENLDEFTTNLRERGITSYFTTMRYCLGTVEIFVMPDGSRCTSVGTYYESYVVWREPEGNTMLKKIDNCGLFYSIELSDNSVYDFFEVNSEDLLTEEVKKYDVKNPGNRPTQRTEVHPCRREFKFVDEANKAAKQYRLYDLTNSSSQENLHYEYNKNLKIVELDQKLDAVIQNNEANFRRVN